MSIDYGSHVIGYEVVWRDPYLWVGMLACLTWGTITIWSIRKRCGVIAFCMIAMAVAYAPTSNAISLIVVNMAERWMYMPSAFLFILIGILFSRWDRRAVNVGVGMLVLLLSIRTVSYAARWNNEVGFLGYSQRQQPRSSMLNVLVAENLRMNGHADEAEEFLKSKLGEFSDCWDVWEELANDAAMQRHWTDADRYIEASLRLDRHSMRTAFLIQSMKQRAGK